MNYFKKSLGQNFLIDANIIKKIVNLVEVKNNNIIEIGPGQGALTEEILKKKPKTLSLIEKDASFFKELKLKYTKKNNIKIYNKDILSFNLEKICLKNSIIFGNLPYNISSQILVKIIKFKKWTPNFVDLVLMFQRELGKKIIGKYPSTDYGRLSILTNYRLKIIKNFLISPNCFKPKPKVTSMLIHFQPKKLGTHIIKKINNLEKITNIIFSNKRKMINKNIKKLLSLNKIQKISDLKLSLRPSEIRPEIYYKITELFEKK